MLIRSSYLNLTFVLLCLILDSSTVITPMGNSTILIMNIVMMVLLLTTDVMGIHLELGTADGVCDQIVTRTVSYLAYVTRKRLVCNLSKNDCKVMYFTASETRYRTEQSTVHGCCEGFVEIDGMCTRDDSVILPNPGETERQTGEPTNAMSTPTYIGIVAAVSVVLIAVIGLCAAFVHKRKPKLNFLTRLRGSGGSSEPHYSEANDYSYGYLEPLKAGVPPAIGNTLYKRETLGPSREANVYTDLQVRTYANKSDVESNEYTALHEPKSPPVRNLTALFEDKSDTQSSSKANKQKERANTSPIKKTHIQKEGRSNSSPHITQHVKNAEKTEKPVVQKKDSLVAHSQPASKGNTGRTVSVSSMAAAINTNQLNAGVHSFINKVKGQTGQENANSSSTVPKPIVTTKQDDLHSSMIVKPTVSRNGNDEKPSTLTKPTTTGHTSNLKPSVVAKPKSNEHKDKLKPIIVSKITSSMGKTGQKPPTPQKPTSPRKSTLNNVIQKWESKTLNKNTEVTRSDVTHLEDPPCYEDAHFYDYVH